MTSKSPEQLITKDGLRVDGRKLDELRPLKMVVQVLSRPDGSAYVEHGKNKVYAAVHGPRELHPRHLSLPDRARIRVVYRMATFSVNDRKRPAPSRREYEISKVIREALEPALFVEEYPRTGIDIFIEVVQADGGTRTASINAAVLALADAGIPLRTLPVACAVGKIDGKMALDLNDVEDQKGEADLPIAWLPLNERFTLFQMDGRISLDEFAEAIKIFKKGAAKISEIQQSALKEKYLAIREDIDNLALEEKTKEALEKAEKPKPTKTTKTTKKKETKTSATKKATDKKTASVSKAKKKGESAESK
jgi:exosome complex component RRP41